ncbi:MAG: NUDIX domain-containing protein [Mycobacteriales bacterium]
MSGRRTTLESAARLWRRISGPMQWRILWLSNAKFGAGVVGVIRDDAGRVLLLRHRFHQTDDWSLPGGWMHKSERFEDGLAREIHEETGYCVEIDQLVRLTSGYRLRVEVSYSGRLVGGHRHLDPREVLAAEFFAPDALPDDVLPVHREMIAVADAHDPSGPAS